MFFSFLIIYSESKILEDMVKKYGSQLNANSSLKYQNQAIEWALSDLAHQVDKIVIANEVKIEIVQQINEILDRLEIADGVLQKNYNDLQEEFISMNRALGDLVQNTQRQIYYNIEDLKKEIIETVEEVFDNSPAAIDESSLVATDYIESTFRTLKRRNVIEAIIIFIVCQFIFGIIIVSSRTIAKDFISKNLLK